MSEKYFSLEAIPQSKLLDLPNFHVLAYRKEDTTMAGHCLDFGIWAYSEQKNDTKALEHISNRLSDMVLMHILGHLKRRTTDYLYNNAVEVDGEWNIFFKYHSIYKINALRKSFDALIDDPSLIEKKIREDKFSMIDLPNVKQEALQSLQEILQNLRELDPGKAEKAISEMLSIIPRYKLKLVS